MREIKFRGRKINTTEWVIGNLAYINEDTSTCGLIVDNHALHIVYLESVGQYTGLTGRNSVEIYEGDIIRFKHESETEWEVSDVMYFGDTEWEYPAFDLNGLHIKSHFESHVLQTIICTGEYDCEIIGNIYENNDLLATV